MIMHKIYYTGITFANFQTIILQYLELRVIVIKIIMITYDYINYIVSTYNINCINYCLLIHTFSFGSWRYYTA